MDAEQAKIALRIIEGLKESKDIEAIEFFLEFLNKVEDLGDEDFVPHPVPKDPPIPKSATEEVYEVNIDEDGFHSIA